MQIRVNFAHGGGPLGRGDTSKWRHGIPWSSIPCSRALAWRSSHAFPRFSVCSCVAVPTASFFSLGPSLIRILAALTFALPLVPGLRRRSLPYPRLFNSRAWARAYRSVLLRLVKLTLNARRSSFPLRPFLPPFSASISLSRAAHARQKATRVPLKRLQSRGPLEANVDSIVDLCTICVERIGTLPEYEINFVHAPLVLRPCNYQ